MKKTFYAFACVLAVAMFSCNLETPESEVSGGENSGNGSQNEKPTTEQTLIGRWICRLCVYTGTNETNEEILNQESFYPGDIYADFNANGMFSMESHYDGEIEAKSYGTWVVNNNTIYFAIQSLDEDIPIPLEVNNGILNITSLSPTKLTLRGVSTEGYEVISFHTYDFYFEKVK